MRIIKKNIISINEQSISDLYNLSNDIPVITIIGEARLGKSTFLNMMISYLEGTDMYVFKTDDTNEHCTQGLDIYVYQQKYIFIDCQGISHQDSSNDIKLLLLPYLISDIIIFNTDKINNTTLKLLEPLVSFSNFIEIDRNQNKPTLFIRVKDYSLETDINSVLLTTLEQREDQYDSIRNNVRQLFESVHAISTDVLDRLTIRRIRAMKYRDIMVNRDNGFQCAIVTIMTKCLENKHGNKKLKKIKQYINFLNKNEKIDYTLLDTYSLIMRNELNEFMSNINKELYQKINVTNKQSEYEMIISKMYEYNKLIKLFNDKYESVDEEL